jgi:dimeric dUTPase (all-alpha-NTP-PPase superfamily)
MSDFKIMKGLTVPKIYCLPKEALTEMLRMQTQINSKYVKGDLNFSEREQWSKDLLLALMDEMSELLGQINWKWWSKNRKEIDVIELKFELIDMLHFILSLMLVWGMTDKEIYTMYMAKANENLDRQKRGY